MPTNPSSRRVKASPLRLLGLLGGWVMQPERVDANPRARLLWLGAPLVAALLWASSAPATVTIESVTVRSTAHSETYGYDAAGRLTTVSYDDGSSIAYQYDLNGNILAQTYSVPEPGPMWLQLAGLCCIGALRRLRVAIPRVVVGAIRAADHHRCGSELRAARLGDTQTASR